MTAPACDPTTLSDDPCAGGCGRRYHRYHRNSRGNTQACVNGHPRHSGLDRCPGCYQRHHRSRNTTPGRNDGPPVTLRILQDHGACRVLRCDAGDELFFPRLRNGQNVRPTIRPLAEQYCGGCPVLDECDRYAEQTHSVGLWAGVWRSYRGTIYTRSPVLPEAVGTAS